MALIQSTKDQITKEIENNIEQTTESRRPTTERDNYFSRFKKHDMQAIVYDPSLKDVSPLIHRQTLESLDGIDSKLQWTLTAPHDVGASSSIT